MVIQLHICYVCSGAQPQKILKMLQFSTFGVHLTLLNFRLNNFQEYKSCLIVKARELWVMLHKM